MDQSQEARERESSGEALVTRDMSYAYITVPLRQVSCWGCDVVFLVLHGTGNNSEEGRTAQPQMMNAIC